MDLKRYESQDAACVENILENCRKTLEDADLKITAFLNAVDVPHNVKPFKCILKQCRKEFKKAEQKINELDCYTALEETKNELKKHLKKLIRKLNHHMLWTPLTLVRTKF